MCIADRVQSAAEGATSSHEHTNVIDESRQKNY